MASLPVLYSLNLQRTYLELYRDFINISVVMLSCFPFSGKFLPFKTPLSSKYDGQIAEECRFDINMLFMSAKARKVSVLCIFSSVDTDS